MPNLFKPFPPQRASAPFASQLEGNIDRFPCCCLLLERIWQQARRPATVSMEGFSQSMRYITLLILDSDQGIYSHSDGQDQVSKCQPGRGDEESDRCRMHGIAHPSIEEAPYKSGVAILATKQIKVHLVT
jgi:hypothetical protein